MIIRDHVILRLNDLRSGLVNDAVFVANLYNGATVIEKIRAVKLRLDDDVVAFVDKAPSAIDAHGCESAHKWIHLFKSAGDFQIVLGIDKDPTAVLLQRGQLFRSGLP